jgi:hypothetical protein
MTITWIVVTIPKRVTVAFENDPNELCDIIRYIRAGSNKVNHRYL